MKTRRLAVEKISVVAISVALMLPFGATALAFDGTPATTIDVAKTLDGLALSSVQLPISNQVFLYGPKAETFDVERYLESKAPTLQSKAELIQHWAGYYSINPKIVLALAEMKSGVLSAPNPRNLKSPFGELVQTNKADDAWREVMHQLSVVFYGYEEKRAEAEQAAKLGNINAATAAIVGVLSNASANTLQGEQQSKLLSTFVQQFMVLFPEDAGELLTNAVDRSAFMARQAPPTAMMQLPWRQGYSWRSNGAHSHTGSGLPLSSIDVSYDWPGWGNPTYSVTAAHDGTVRVMSRCQLRVSNPNGWATNYYHMDGIQVSNGQWVTANTKLGVYASSRSAALCQGGSSTGPHLHFSLLNNGRYVSLQDVNFSVYRVNVGSYNYDSNCNRFWFSNLSSGSYQCAWSWMQNYGPWAGN